jgi:hypothetical protein
VAYRADAYGGVFAIPRYRYNIIETDNQIRPKFNVYLSGVATRSTSSRSRVITGVGDLQQITIRSYGCRMYAVVRRCCWRSSIDRRRLDSVRWTSGDIRRRPASVVGASIVIDSVLAPNGRRTNGEVDRSGSGRRAVRVLDRVPSARYGRGRGATASRPRGHAETMVLLARSS